MPGTIFLPKAGPLGTVLGVVVGGLIMAVVAWNYHVMMNRHPGPGGDAALASLRVVVVTADVEVKSRFAEMGFDDILLKPITFAMLDAVLKGNL